MKSGSPNSAPRLVPTALLCLASLAIFLSQSARLTAGFEYWTLESRRQAEARQGQLQTSALWLRDAAGRQHLAFDAAAGSGNKGGIAHKSERLYLVDFIYTRCASVCLALGSEFQQAQALLSAESDTSVGLLSLSIAPDEDSGVDLAKYANRFGANPQHWQVMAPLDQEQSTRYLRELGVVALPDGQGGYVHNGDIHLIDAAGRVRGIWNYGDWRQALAAAQHLAHANGGGS
ncbi:MAG: SCO family protein [Paucibacter sp.]|nr:SCO family protein [Roseateles sp.]